jgi:hypothetical protein
MILDVHEGKISLPVDISSSGDNSIVTGSADSWIYVHEVVGSAASAVTLKVKAGSRVLAEFDLDAFQGLTLNDIPGDDGVPRFKCYPGENFILNLSGCC